VDELVVWWNAIGAETPFGFCCAETSAEAFAWETPKEKTAMDEKSAEEYRVKEQRR